MSGKLGFGKRWFLMIEVEKFKIKMDSNPFQVTSF
jgi:hypothetical protein